MSENLDPVIDRMNSLPELVKQERLLDTKKNNDEAVNNNNSNIFDLINHLNENGQSQNTSVLSSTPTDSQSQIESSRDESSSGQIDLILNSIEPIQVCSDNNAELETSRSSENSSSPSMENESVNNKSSENVSRIPRTRIPVGLPGPRPASSANKPSNMRTTSGSKISKIAVYTRPKPELTPQQTPPPLIKSNASPSDLKKNTPEKNNTKTTGFISSIKPAATKTLPNASRPSPRSYSRDVTALSMKSNKSSDESIKLSKQRGASMSAAISVNSLGSNGKSDDGNKKKVRYAVKHKPRESKVKIFSQKVEIKNVSSKIGSLENHNYKPTGGDVVIETRTLNWNAQSKINSLEKAANYVPNGGNVKIENHKLNWRANSKIGSLEKAATYQPHGGNVKIESHKLNFKARARPKTDTGLVYIEDDDYLDNSSQNISIENLNDTQDYSS